MKGNFSKVRYSPDRQWYIPIWFFLRITTWDFLVLLIAFQKLFQHIEHGSGMLNESL